MEAYVAGVSTRKVDALVAALGSQSGISKSQVSLVCSDIEIQVQIFLSRPLEASGYAFFTSMQPILHGRLGRAMQACSRNVVVTIGVNLMVAGRRSASRWASANPRPWSSSLVY